MSIFKPKSPTAELEHPHEDPRPTNPAYEEAKKHADKKETDKTFGAWLSSFWARAGLSLKTIVGASAAWCGLFVFVMNTEVGQQSIKYFPLARNWAKYGQAIDWKKNGIPRGAVMHLNHSGNCSAGSGNHVTFADGDCAPQDLALKGATVPGFGGNQDNTVKRSNYAVKEVCAVRWPLEIPLPGPITKSVDCSGAPTGGSSR